MGTPEPPLTPELLLAAYSQGLFPMSGGRNDKAIHWYAPKKRGIIPLDHFHIPRSLAREIRRKTFEIRIDSAFPAVIAACAERNEGTWINDEIIAAYTELWRLGFAHSVECWKDNLLAGGLYGVAIGGAFFGESMFSRSPNASKIALVELVTRLRAAGYTLLDAQYVNDHLIQFGIIEILQAEYLTQLHAALAVAPKDCFIS